MYAYRALMPMNRKCCLGMSSVKSCSDKSGIPRTWLLIPKSAYSCEKVIPLFALYKCCFTSSKVLPRHEVIPIPVTTTRGVWLYNCVEVDDDVADFNEATFSLERQKKKKPTQCQKKRSILCFPFFMPFPMSRQPISIQLYLWTYLEQKQLRQMVPRQVQEC